MGRACERVVWWWWLRCLMRRGTLQVAVEERRWGCDCQETAGQAQDSRPAATTTTTTSSMTGPVCCVCCRVVVECEWSYFKGKQRRRPATKSSIAPLALRAQMPLTFQPSALTTHLVSHAARPRRTPYTDTGTNSTGRLLLFVRVQSEVKPKCCTETSPPQPTLHHLLQPPSYKR